VRLLIVTLGLFAGASGMLFAQASTVQDGKPWFVLNGNKQVTLHQAGARPLGNPIRLTITDTPPSGVVGIPYSFQFTATGGSGSYQWNWFPFDGNGGEIPPGLTLSPTGMITGTPTQVSSGNGFLVEVEVSDTMQEGTFGSMSFAITVAACTPTFAATAPLPTDDVSIPYPRFQFEAQGCATPYTFTGPSPFASAERRAERHARVGYQWRL
jgi:hypothetical protein